MHVGKGLGKDSKKEIERERERQNSKRKQVVGIKDEKEGVKRSILVAAYVNPAATLANSL